MRRGDGLIRHSVPKCEREGRRGRDHADRLHHRQGTNDAQRQSKKHRSKASTFSAPKTNSPTAAHLRRPDLRLFESQPPNACPHHPAQSTAPSPSCPSLDWTTCTGPSDPVYNPTSSAVQISVYMIPSRPIFHGPDPAPFDTTRPNLPPLAILSVH